ncbi:acyltransferase domain-containing protein [Phytoactinopolyspora halophila]|nr:acyltransferase domain-containing protein [Phytoactinopolyspora halophila]
MTQISEESIFLFGGQGSQYFGMALSLYRENAEFRRSMDWLNSVCQSRHGISVIDYIYDERRGMSEPCDDLALSNAAIFMIEYALSDVLRKDGVIPSRLIGCSLGEFVAMAVAGHISAERVLDFVVELARSAERYLPPGGMLAVLGDPGLYNSLPELRENTEIASVSHDRHFIVAGGSGGLRRAAQALDDRDVIAVMLPVRFAFHSSAMDSLRDVVSEVADSMAYDEPASTVVSASTGGAITRFEPVDCWRTLRNPIAFTDAISSIPAAESYTYIDLTPSSTLATMMKSSHPEYVAYPIITPFGNELANLESIRSSLPRVSMNN